MRLNARDGWWGDDPQELPEGALPIGYAWMVREHNLDVMPHFRWSFAARVGARHRFVFQTLQWEVFPASYRPADLPGQIEFALKYDGMNLEILRAFFDSLKPEETGALETWIRGAPTSAYARRAWFLYELLTAHTLDVEDARAGAYAPALDPEHYFVAADRRSKRHRVMDNFFGGRDFCALVRRTAALDHFVAQRLDRRAVELLAHEDTETLARVVSYLYTKETRSSFEIEREVPTTDKLRRFVAVLQQAHDWPAVSQADLVRLQNLIVTDPRNRDSDYRCSQNYVADSRLIHFVAPRPQDLQALMTGWLKMLARLTEGDTDAVVAAAAAAFSFVYLHPFEDGNGRIHRFLIHFVLSRRRFTPPGMLLPVSATMLSHMKEYDAALERFSEPLMVRLRYEVVDFGGVEVGHDSSGYYRYPDLTSQAEALYGWVASTLETEVPRELQFMVAYRDARRRIAKIVELPDRKAEHFVARCIENGGHLSKNRRKGDFGMLTEAELEEMEAAVRAAMREAGIETSL